MQVLGPVAITVATMWSKLGNPLNWWVPFFGTSMTANKEKIAAREKAGEDAHQIHLELAQWVQECTRSRWYQTNPYTYKFLRKGDAAMFKLAWM